MPNASGVWPRLLALSRTLSKWMAPVSSANLPFHEKVGSSHIKQPEHERFLESMLRSLIRTRPPLPWCPEGHFRLSNGGKVEASYTMRKSALSKEGKFCDKSFGS